MLVKRACYVFQFQCVKIHSHENREIQRPSTKITLDRRLDLSIVLFYMCNLTAFQKPKKHLKKYIRIESSELIPSMICIVKNTNAVVDFLEMYSSALIRCRLARASR